MGIRSEEQRVSIRRAAGDELGTDDAAGTRPIVDHNVAPPLFRELRPEQSPEYVHPAACGEGHDNAHRLLRELLRQRRAVHAREDTDSKYECDIAKSHHVAIRINRSAGARA